METLVTKLIQDNRITSQQLASAEEEAKRIGKSLWAALVKLGILSEEEVAIFFAQESGIPYIRIADYKINPEVVGLLEEDFCRQNMVVPVFRIENTLFAAAVNPLDTDLQDALASKTGCLVELLFACYQDINKALDLYYGLKDIFRNLQNFIFKESAIKPISSSRESERLLLNIPIELNLEDKNVALAGLSSIEGVTCNISLGGTAVGLEVLRFIPEGANVLLKLRASGSVIIVRGVVIYCAMLKEGRYFLGIKFIGIRKADIEALMSLARGSAR